MTTVCAKLKSISQTWNCRFKPSFLVLPMNNITQNCWRVAWWLATCARKPNVPGSSPAASYVQR